ncbi:MAG: hypothetical protein A2Z11_01535 [Candidatus Woykebacteria bacterium RBG_16_43_9]|uniref:Peptidase S8/S53 domain-containing protein n=1 Tax=Candidatus Woykebacteria bacterium RBG_16_43_9 TaxID=1802596 RepID=A0A1G1WGK8_9BACT|nr:MAG: hypothetical protein A2Z11_01535 [Candidatus Woykebacteria bacterium RBG_16_43_9]
MSIVFSKMKLPLVLLLLLALVAISVNTAVAGTKTNSNNNKVRVVAITGQETSQALSKGCKPVRKVKTLTALICSENIATSLGLKEDIRVFALDTDANTQIKADSVHSSRNTGSGTKVAVIDTGYNYKHPELASSYLGGIDLVNNDSDPLDDNGHGSHVSGLITADGVASKAKGVAPDVEVLAVKVLNQNGGGYFSDVVAGIYWVINGPDGVYGTSDDPNVDAINLSLGTSSPYVYKSFCDGVLPDLTNAIKYARDKGVLVAAAAGNRGSAGVSIPGCISYSTTVGAVNKWDKIASFSGRGKAVDITTPGVSLYSAWLGTDYKSASGTSMAAPIVSGVTALIKVTKPGYSVYQIEEALFNTAKDLGKSGKDNAYGWGRVEAFAAVNN